MSLRPFSQNYIGLTLEDAFALQNEFAQWRESGHYKVDKPQSSSNWYTRLQEWTPGVRQMYDYSKLFRRHRINTNNRGHFTIQEFWRKFPASYVFETSCHIKYQCNMYWEMAQDHERREGSKWTLDNKMFLKRPI